MKNKKILIVIILLMATMILPLNINAEELDLTIYASETLQETFAEENITGDFTNYQDTEDRATIYVFRQDRCLNCKNFYNYVATTLLANYSDKFRVISYEVRNNQLNNNLRMKVQKFLGEDVNITPYIIIGEKTFSGHIDSTKQREIESAIISLYNNTNKYDVLKDMKDNKKEFSDLTSGIIINSLKALNKNHTLKTTATNRNDLSIPDFNNIISYDIKVMDDQNNLVSLANGNFTIKIPINQSYDIYKVVSIDNSGATTEINQVEYKNGYVVFNTTNLSEYIVYGKNNKPVDSINETNNKVNEKNPNTLDNIQTNILILIVGSISLISSIIILNRKTIKNKSSM